jgi:hypothetical protein
VPGDLDRKRFVPSMELDAQRSKGANKKRLEELTSSRFYFYRLNAVFIMFVNTLSFLRMSTYDISLKSDSALSFRYMLISNLFRAWPL